MPCYVRGNPHPTLPNSFKFGDRDGAKADIPAGAEATEVGSMSSTSGCGATEGVSHAKSLWQRLSGGEGSERVNEDERQRNDEAAQS